MSRASHPGSGTGLTRGLGVILAVLLGCPVPGRATVGFSCSGGDDAAEFVVNGAYGSSLGAGLAAFGAEIKILLPSVPIELRDLRLDRSHVRQDWFVGRDIKLLMRWEPIDDAPYREAILIIEARRGKAEESAYRGRYSLRLQWRPPDPGAETKKLETSGKVSCGTG